MAHETPDSISAPLLVNRCPPNSEQEGTPMRPGQSAPPVVGISHREGRDASSGLVCALPSPLEQGPEGMFVE